MSCDTWNRSSVRRLVRDPDMTICEAGRAEGAEISVGSGALRTVSPALAVSARSRGMGGAPSEGRLRTPRTLHTDILLEESRQHVNTAARRNRLLQKIMKKVVLDTPRHRRDFLHRRATPRITAHAGSSCHYGAASRHREGQLRDRLLRHRVEQRRRLRGAATWSCSAHDGRLLGRPDGLSRQRGLPHRNGRERGLAPTVHEMT